MSWQFFILLHALFWALQSLQLRFIARQKSARHAGLAINALAFTSLYVCGLLAIPFLGEVNSMDALTLWPSFLATALLFDIGLYFLYKSLTHLESATVSVLATSSALFTVLIAGFFFGERFTAGQIVGISILLPCIWYVLWLAKEHHKLMNFQDVSWLKGFWYVISASFCLALGHVIEKELLYQTNTATYLAYGWALQAAGAWLLFIIFGKRARSALKNKKLVRASLQTGVLRAVTGLSFILALIASNSVSLMMVLANFRIIIVAVLAGWLLGERRFFYKKLAAAALSVVGLSIIFWN